MEPRKHFVLVHGSSHGAWCWYKVKPVLERAGHRVTALDLAASGINLKNFREIRALIDYSEPLIKFLESLKPEDEKVILVGHSMGGMNIALAAEKFPEKISAAVFVAALMPDTSHRPSYVLEKFFETSKEEFEDAEFAFDEEGGNKVSSILFGPKGLSSKLYHLSPIEDLTLAMTLTRMAPVLFKDSSDIANRYSEQRYGSVGRVYVVSKQDKLFLESFQRWMIQNYPVRQVVEINGADHMVMVSAPHQLCCALLDIACNYG
ncbi:hypothetical protein Sjap_010124 [Stephania japonica]|uniref:AB hydrolase-1 domain-containing protein n=1 Tax=Stephania japonica TaxID=461633 RepID=A0AAP0P3C5_9MAGN